MIDLKNLTIKKARKMLDSGEITAVKLAEAYLKNIKEKNGELHAYLEVFDDVLEQAKEADKRIKSGEKKSLLGIPIAIKDNILINGRRVGSASKILEGYIAPYDATVIKKLKGEGVVFLGRANMDEFAMGSSTENSAYGPSKNPIDTNRVPGGSSGGSASAVAGDLALGALGSDTGGSIRQPASFCGLVGLKPTYGSVSRFGLMAMGSSLDVIGPITKTVEDAEIIFNAIKGKDENDLTSKEIDLENDKKKTMKVADMTDFIEKVGQGGVDASVMKNYKDSLDILEKKGHKIVKIKTDLTPLIYSLATYYIIMPAEVSTNLSRFDGMRFGFYKDSGKNLLEDYKQSRGIGFGKEARRRILLGAYVLSSGYYDAYYGKATLVRELIKNTLDNVFKEADLIATPTTPSPAFRFGEKVANPVEMYLADIFTVTANMADIPAISIPSGFVKIESKDLPLGLQFMAPIGKDHRLFAIGKSFLQENN